MLARRYRLEDVHHYDPPMGFIDDPAEVTRAARFLRDTRARYSFLAVGSPQQEMLAHTVARMGGGAGLGFCIGASLDFLTGSQDRAPRVLQQLSLEWLYRLCRHPRRMWRRYLVDGPAIFQIARQWRRDRAPG
jgi:exopolysaccharide biosynthesis WecB/TagA/CpsF family protein